MGQSLVSRFRHSRRDINLGIVGLYEAGKTTLLYQMEKDAYVICPIVGMTLKQADFKNFHITSLDVGGRCSYRPLFKHYYSKMDAVIFMVDSANRDCLEHVKFQFQRLADEEDLRNVPLVVVANKQDLPSALSVDELAKHLELERARLHRSVEIFPASALTGDGVEEVLEWILHQLKRQDLLKTLVKPVEEAIPHHPETRSFLKSMSLTLKQTFGTMKNYL